MADTHYIYGRLHFKDAASFMLPRDGSVMHLRDDSPLGPDTAEAVFYVHACDRLEARMLIGKMRALHSELGHLADDLERYIDCHDFDGPASFMTSEDPCLSSAS